MSLKSDRLEIGLSIDKQVLSMWGGKCISPCRNISRLCSLPD